MPGSARLTRPSWSSIALTIVPGHPAAHFNRGIALFNLGRYGDAVEAHDSALEARPIMPVRWLNRGRALAALKRFDDAIASYGKASAMRKDDADVDFKESLALLSLGDYRRGFEKYEWRWRRSEMPRAERPRPPAVARRISADAQDRAVPCRAGSRRHHPVARYVPLLAETGARIVLEVQPELPPLMSRLEGAAAIIARGEPPQQFDVHCPFGSLPLAFKTEPPTVAAEIPYLAADDVHLAKWSPRLGGLERPRIAIAWSGESEPSQRPQPLDGVRQPCACCRPFQRGS